MEIKNIGGKIIGIGNVTVLPGETKVVPEAYEHSPILAIYEAGKMAEIVGEPQRTAKTEEETEADQKKAEEQSALEAEALRKSRLASLSGISEEDLGALAKELGINPADCKNQADVLKKVKAALK